MPSLIPAFGYNKHAERTHSVMFEGESALPKPETPLQEAWRIFQQDRLASVAWLFLHFWSLWPLRAKC